MEEKKSFSILLRVLCGGMNGKKCSPRKCYNAEPHIICFGKTNGPFLHPMTDTPLCGDANAFSKHTFLVTKTSRCIRFATAKIQAQ